jgi:MFS family permease
VRTPLTWLIYVQLALYAYFLYGFGPIVGFLRDEQGTSNALASLHTAALAVGAMVGGALFPWFSQRFGRGTAMWAALGAVALAVLGFVALPAAYPVTLTLSALVAFGGMWIVSCVVVTLSQMHGPAGSAAISEANAMAVAAGFVAPLVVGWAVEVGLGWRAGIVVLIGLIGIVALVAWRMRIMALPAGDSPAATAAEPKAALPRAYWLAWMMMVMTGTVEIVMSLWAAIVLRDEAGFSAGSAAAAVSAILGGMLIGRTFGARLALRMGTIPLYFAALVVSFAGFLIFWFAGSAWSAIVGLFVIGLGNAMHYPLAIALAISLAPGQADRAAGVSSYSMGLSFGLGPFLLGLLADEVGAHTALLLIPLFLAAAALLALRLRGSADAPKVGNRPAEIAQQMA